MTQDDPFSTGSNKTVIRPNPGLRRPSEPAAPGAVAMGAAHGGDAPMALPVVGTNPLVSAAAPLLALAVRLRSATPLANLEALRDRVVNEIHAFERLVSSTDEPREALRGGHYAICATIDDVINNTPWGGAQWARQSVCGLFHKDTSGGDRFFEFLGHFQREPGRYTHVLELMYLCLSLGFQGRFRVTQRGASELTQMREGLYNLLRQSRSEVERELSPHWRGLEAPHRPLSAVLPTWVVGIAVLAVLAVVYAVFVYLLNDKSDPVFDRLANLPPTGPVSLQISAPAPPPPQHDTLLQRLNTFLAPEIKEELVTVSATAQTATVRIRGNDLFASGTAALNDKYAPLIGRIAAALDKEQGSVLVVGHTDNVPIRTLRFPSNYQLSVARAETVRDLLRRGVTQTRTISSEGRADSDPVKPNDSPEGRAFNNTPDGRALNRRIEVVLNRQDDGQ
jgi:type VI secretion system protein ImpK